MATTPSESTALQNLPPVAWDSLAMAAVGGNGNNGYRGATVAERMREDYEQAVRTAEEYAAPAVVVSRPETEVLASGDIHFGPIEIKILGIVSIDIEGTFHPGDRWYLQGTLHLKAAGKVLWTNDYRLSWQESSISLHPNLEIVKADLTIGVFGSTHCLKVSGQGCYLSWSGWQCASFDQTLHCFGLIGDGRGFPDGGLAVAAGTFARGVTADPYAEFTGGCGPNSTATSEKGLKVYQQVKLNGETDLSSCVQGNNEACAYTISLNHSAGIYSYEIAVDGQGPRGLTTGNFYLAFKDATGAIHRLSIYRSGRSRHTVAFNSTDPTIKSFKWSNNPISHW